jgi:uncharacterized membrane protein
VPDLSHLWQRFLLAVSLLAGLAIGVGATVFGYSNLNTVDIHWSVVQLKGVPLWAVVIVPITLILIAGTIFHWLDSLHHFTEHMRHRRRVHELEAEVSRLRAHLDQVLEMPKQVEGAEPAKVDKPALPEANIKSIDAEMAAAEPAAEVAPKPAKAARKAAKPATNGEGKVEEAEIAASTSAPNDAG